MDLVLELPALDTLLLRKLEALIEILAAGNCIQRQTDGSFARSTRRIWEEFLSNYIELLGGSIFWNDIDPDPAM